MRIRSSQAHSDIFKFDKRLQRWIVRQNCCCIIFRQSMNQIIVSAQDRCTMIALTSLRFTVSRVGGYLSLWRVLTDRQESPSEVPMHPKLQRTLGSATVTYKHSQQRSHVLSIHDWSFFCFKYASLFLRGTNKSEKQECCIPPLLHGRVWLRSVCVCVCALHTHKQTHCDTQFAIPGWGLSLCSCKDRKDSDQINPALIFALTPCSVLPPHHTRLLQAAGAVVCYLSQRGFSERTYSNLDENFEYLTASTERKSETVFTVRQKLVWNDTWQNEGCVRTCDI